MPSPTTPIYSPLHELPASFSDLDIIEENQREDTEPRHHVEFQNPDEITVEFRNGAPPSKHESRVESLSKIVTQPMSPTPSDSETVAPASPRSSGSFHKGTSSSFGRLLSGSKNKDADKPRAVLVRSPTKEMDKTLKAAEKQRQKEEAKARKEKLAQDLKDRSRAQSRAADRSSISSAERKKNETAMYGGMVGFTM